ncbi:MAG: COX15/CtaA family protein [Dehalococcoidia bacterium]|nr:COX15/CtaA family protein [Dehalococcoidia bacterium]
MASLPASTRPHAAQGSRAYRRSSILTIAATILLIGAGSVVRTSGSGLGCPDWPLCHGQVLPPLERTALIEWSHRTIAAVTGAMILTVAAWTWVRYRTDRIRAAASLAAAPLLAIQALLGREAVVRELPPVVVATHLITGMLLLSALVVLATPRRTEADGAARDRLRPSIRIALAASALTITLGAVMVAEGAAYACTSWPGCAEAAFPWQGTDLHVLHWLHRGATLFALLAAVNLAVRAHRLPASASAIHATAAVVLALYVVQALLGAANVLWQPGAARIAHLVIAAIIWAILVALTIRAGALTPARTASTAD